MCKKDFCEDIHAVFTNKECSVKCFTPYSLFRPGVQTMHFQKKWRSKIWECLQSYINFLVQLTTQSTFCQNRCFFGMFAFIFVMFTYFWSSCLFFVFWDFCLVLFVWCFILCHLHFSSVCFCSSAPAPSTFTCFQLSFSLALCFMPVMVLLGVS